MTKKKKKTAKPAKQKAKKPTKKTAKAIKADAKTLATFILLDRSSSMSGRWNEALASINAYVQQLVKNKTKDKITVAVFDERGGTDFQVIRSGIAVADWKDITNADAQPRGGTPLYDATLRIVDLAKLENAESTVILIMTDGEENASEASKEQAVAALDAAKAKGCEVLFLGADFDAVKQARSVGVAVSKSLNMTTGNYSKGMVDLADKRTLYATCSASIDITAADRAAQTKASTKANPLSRSS